MLSKISKILKLKKRESDVAMANLELANKALQDAKTLHENAINDYKNLQTPSSGNFELLRQNSLIKKAHQMQIQNLFFSLEMCKFEVEEKKEAYLKANMEHEKFKSLLEKLSQEKIKKQELNELKLLDELGGFGFNARAKA